MLLCSLMLRPITIQIDISNRVDLFGVLSFQVQPASVYFVVMVVMRVTCITGSPITVCVPRAAAVSVFTTSLQKTETTPTSSLLTTFTYLLLFLSENLFCLRGEIGSHLT